MSTTRTVHRPHRLLLAAALLLSSTLATPALAHGAAAGEPGQRGQALGRIEPGLGAQLAQVRAATARYHDVEVAVAEGFVEASPCVEGPDGAMGYHYVHFGRLGQLDATLPQALLYVPEHDGRLRLVGVEYLGMEGANLFGQQFTPGPAGYALHVWLWQANPAGMFADYNPNLSC
jgi:hypothetical protein